MPNKGGILGGLANLGAAIAHELDDGSGNPKADATPATPKSASIPAPPFVAPVAPVTSPSTGTMPYTFGTTPLSTLPGAGGPEPIDEAALAAVNDGVFGSASSHYTQFVNVWTTLGRPGDISTVLKTMQAMDRSLTAAVILADINNHLSRLDAVSQSASGEFDKAAQEKLGGADATLAQLNQQNETAQAEIARHQKETGERMAQIAAVTQQRAADDAAISRAKARTEAAAASVKQQLVSMQAMLSSLPV